MIVGPHSCGRRKCESQAGCIVYHCDVRNRAQSVHTARRFFRLAGSEKHTAIAVQPLTNCLFPFTRDASAATVTAEPLCLWRITLEARQFVGALHPIQPLGGLDMHHCRNGIGVVVGRALNIDYPGQDIRIDVEKPRAAVGAEVAAAML